MKKQQQRKQKRWGSSKEKNPQTKKIDTLLGLVDPYEKFRVGNSLQSIFLKTPRGPMAGAAYTTRQIAGTLTTSSGLSNLGGTSTAQLILNSPTGNLFSMGFELADLGQYTTFGALFDQYRFEKVKAHFKSRSNAISVFNTASPNSSVPIGYVVVDRDDASAPASLAALIQYDNVHSFSGLDDFDIELVPSLTPAVYASGAFTGYGVSPSNAIWLDAANVNVPHFGIKGGLSGLTTSTTSSWTWDVIVEYVISFRRTR